MDCSVTHLIRSPFRLKSGTTSICKDIAARPSIFARAQLNKAGFQAFKASDRTAETWSEDYRLSEAVWRLAVYTPRDFGGSGQGANRAARVAAAHRSGSRHATRGLGSLSGTCGGHFSNGSSMGV